MRLRGKPALLIQAFFALNLACLLIALLPFHRIAKMVAGQNRSVPQSATPDEAESIGRAIRAWAGHLPWRAVCFQQGLAAFFVLRHKRLNATLYYGANNDADKKLVAHVWVQSGDIDVIGCETAKDFALLAAFPEYGLANP
jgi:Transglutaminase-like superfamily